MADGSASALAELLLADEAPRPSQSLIAALASDPPLVLWTVCVADREDGFQPRCLDDVVRWLAQHALEVLQWEADQDSQPEALWTSQSESCADQVASAAQVADLAARLDAEGGPSTADSAFLLGLLHDADRWLALAGNPEAKDTSGCLPAWLLEADDTPAAASVKLAVELLAGEASLPDSARIDLETCRGVGAEARRRWLAPVVGVGNWLPPLAAKLARLASLEGQFQETLETEKLEAMAEFAAGAGHEINNPLTVISGRAQYFLKDEKSPERRHGWALIHTQAKRASEMLGDMMLFARPPKPEPTSIDLVELVDRVLEEVSSQAARQEITLRRAGQPGPVGIEADGTQLTVALRAMCQNSLEAIGRDGHVEISVHQDAHAAQIRIADDGPGIPPEERRHLFDPYYSARQAGRGLGLGLSKCWRIVTNHGGRIEVDSQPGQGTVFTISLPLRQP
ncbi:MAG: sensor histidine kinase [Planctomycetota bacterium]|jgi:signal transduction histidine kinase